MCNVTAMLLSGYLYVTVMLQCYTRYTFSRFFTGLRQVYSIIRIKLFVCKPKMCILGAFPILSSFNLTCYGFELVFKLRISRINRWEKQNMDLKDNNILETYYFTLSENSINAKEMKKP